MEKDLVTDFNDTENLDPSDWEKYRRSAHIMLDDMIDFISEIRNKAVWQPVPIEIKKKFDEPLPDSPSSLETVYQEFKEFVQPYTRGNIHPRFWGWVDGAGTPSIILYEMLAAALNANLVFGDSAGSYMELQIVKWFSSIFGYSEDASGSIVTGGTTANFSALAAARTSVKDLNIKEHGVNITSGKLRLYCSTETHNSVQKSVELLGLGKDAIRFIPVDENFRINISLLSHQIKEDRSNGDIPFCIVANLGTVNTGAIDPLAILVQIAKEEDLWLHIDGAFGATLKILPEYKESLAMIKEADSIAFDFHKWFHIQYDAGCVLVKKGGMLKKTFEVNASYLSSYERGISAGPPLNESRLDLSRNSKNLKIWMSLKEHGMDKYRRMVRKNLNQAQYLAQKIMSTKELELMAPVEMNVVAFRYNRAEKGVDLNWINKEIVMSLQLDGKIVVSGTILRGQLVIRAAITNHRSELQDFDLLVREVLRWGNELEVPKK